jgi:hypothetical protein
MLRTALASLFVLVCSTSAAAGELKAGWTPELLGSETEDCSQTLVQGAWENTKREQGADPSIPLTPEIRKQIEPQIAAMKDLCACAVRAGAERYTKAEADKTPADLDRFIEGAIDNGTCKLPPVAKPGS